MIKGISVDFTYVEEIFDFEQECKHFLMLMYAEFQESVDFISKSIKDQNIYALRKILHNVGTHLEMLRADDLQEVLLKVKNCMVTSQLSESEKQQLIDEVNTHFAKLLLILSERIQEYN